MSLLDVYKGRMEWAEYLSQQKELAGLTELARRNSLLSESQGAEQSLKLSLSKQEYQAAQTGGLGAMRNRARDEVREAFRTMELSLSALAGGVAQLKADFTPLLGDVVWKLEMQRSALLDVLQEIRLAEFEREARAYRTRAERAYLNGWYEEALRDFLKAEKRNYPDYAVLRSIANIYLYHAVNLPNALAYFRKAAKYARPSDAQQAAEAHYFAGLVCLIEQQREEALAELQEATRLQPQFAEGHYQLASVAALLGKTEEAISGLEHAAAQ